MSLPLIRSSLLVSTIFGSTAMANDPSVMVAEAHSGRILIAFNAASKRPVASLTKIAVGAVAVDWALASKTDLGKVQLTVPQTVSMVGGTNPLALVPGDRLTLRDALYSALLGSDNLAALSVADHVGRELQRSRGLHGDPVATFVAEMNRLARTLGMNQTRFANPHGLERQGARQFSTAADMARLSIYAMRRNAFNFIVRQPERTVTVIGAAGARTYQVRNTNKLIGRNGITGIKTGTTLAAGECLATCMDREPLVRIKADGNKGVTPRRLVVVVLNEPLRFDRSLDLLSRGWQIYDRWIEAGAPFKNRRREFLEVPDIDL